jgi:hypothetical protein
MKKSMIAVLIAMLALNAVFAFAANQSPGVGGVMPPDVVADNAAPSASTTGFGPSIAHTFAIRTNVKCFEQPTIDPNDQYFLGKARQECVVKNQYNLFCQKRCFTNMQFAAQRYSTASRPPDQYTAYYVTGCTDIDTKPLVGTIGNNCYFAASEACATANSQNNYCRQKCNQRAYSVCRNNVLSARQNRAKTTGFFSRTTSGTV